MQRLALSANASLSSWSSALFSGSNSSLAFKGAVCRILTLLKHKNTIICLQIFKKHAKLTYLFIWKTLLQSVILLWKCVFRPGMSVFVMVCETRPLPVYPIVFRHPGLPVGGKHSAFNFIHHHVRSFLLVSLIWQPATASSLRRRGWWKKTSPIFWIWTAIPSSTVNPTYSTFKATHSKQRVLAHTLKMAILTSYKNLSVGYIELKLHI